jgi:hypothetical protein
LTPPVAHFSGGVTVYEAPKQKYLFTQWRRRALAYARAFRRCDASPTKAEGEMVFIL